MVSGRETRSILVVFSQREVGTNILMLLSLSTHLTSQRCLLTKYTQKPWGKGAAWQGSAASQNIECISGK